MRADRQTYIQTDPNAIPSPPIGARVIIGDTSRQTFSDIAAHSMFNIRSETFGGFAIITI